MEGEKAAAAAAAAGAEWRRQEAVKLLHRVWRYMLFLSVGNLTFAMAPRLAPASRPAIVPSLPAGFGLPVTCGVFTAATMVMQEMLARVLVRKPPPAPRLTPEAAFPVAVLTWMFLCLFFTNYLKFGGDDYFLRSSAEWAAAGVASVLNLVVAMLTLAHYLA